MRAKIDPISQAIASQNEQFRQMTWDIGRVPGTGYSQPEVETLRERLINFMTSCYEAIPSYTQHNRNNPSPTPPPTPQETLFVLAQCLKYYSDRQGQSPEVKQANLQHRKTIFHTVNKLKILPRMLRHAMTESLVPGQKSRL